MVLAMITAARAAGADWVEAVALGNVAAGLEVERFGTVPIKPAEIIQEILTEVHESTAARSERLTHYIGRSWPPTAPAARRSSSPTAASI